MNNRIINLFPSNNGHGHKHPLDIWRQWVIDSHPKIVEYIVGLVHAEEKEGNELAAVYVAAAQATIFAGAQIMFDTTTGEVYTDCEGPDYEPGQVLHDMERAKARCHDWVDLLFNEFTTEYKAKLEINEEEENQEEEDDDDEEEDEDEYWEYDSDLEDE